MKNWAIAVLLFTPKLPNSPEFKAVRNQLVRSAPSAAANYRAACRRKSGKDFLNKLKIVEEELDESMFWLEAISKIPAGLKSRMLTEFGVHFFRHRHRYGCKKWP